MKLPRLRLLLVLTLGLGVLHAAEDPPVDDRIIFDDGITVNGQLVRLAFFTGADRIALFRHAAVRLGLKITPPPPGIQAGPGKTLTSLTEPVELKIFGTTGTTALAVVDFPSGLVPDIDGIVGWPVLKDNIITFDAARSHLAVESKLPASATAWQKLPLRKSDSMLVWELPAGPSGGGAAAVLVDTGSDGGVRLSPARLREWRSAHPGAPSTLDAYYTPGTGTVVREVFWAEQLTVGPLVLSGVTVQEADAGTTASVDGHAATLGLRALKRLNCVVDGKNDIVYFEPVKTPAAPPPHNRLGAVFAPRDVQTSDTLEGHVLVGTPAHEAGIRDGDTLLKIDALDTTKWRTDPAVLPLTRFWQRPAGTKMTLLLKRDGKELSIVVTLRDLIGPGATKAGE